MIGESTDAQTHRSFTVRPYESCISAPHSGQMDIQEINGLPAHPLIVHLPVVLVPLATIGALAMLVRPSWRRHLAVPTALIAAVAAVATQLAISSGEWLEEQVRESNLIEDHSRIAEQARPWIFLFAGVMIVVAVLDVVQRRRAGSALDEHRPPDGEPVAAPVATSTAGPAPRTRVAALGLALGVLGTLLGAVATVDVYRTGHSGATATWHDTTTASPSGADGDDDGD
jgi:uncharacterized membrane protein